MKDHGFKFLLMSRIFRSMALIFMTLASPIYLNDINLTLVQIGIIYVGVMLFTAFLSISLGALGDRKGFKKALILGDIPPILGALLLSLTGNTVLIIIGVIIAGLSGVAGGMRGAFSPGMIAFTARNYPDNKVRVKKFSILVQSASAASIVGALLLVSQFYISTYTGTILSFRVLFGLSAVLTTLSLVSLFFLEEVNITKKSTKIMKKESINYTIKISILNILNGSALGLSLPLLPLFFAIAFKFQSTSTAFYIGIIYLPSYLMTILGSSLSKKYSDRINIINTAKATRVLNGVLFLLMGIIFTMQYYSILVFLPLLLFAAALYSARSLVAGFGSASISTISMSGLNKEDYGTATSIQGLASSLSQSSSGISGYLADYLFPLPMLIGGALQISAGILYPIFIKNNRKINKNKK
ncbi:MAG: MFS transporter [Candidatus Micrarchaeia archaeon]